MGYYSMADLDYSDFSYLSAEQQLKMRLYELKDRLRELTEKDALYHSKINLFDDDIRYSFPEDLNCIDYVERAIDLAEYDLLHKYGIRNTADETRRLAANKAAGECEKPGRTGHTVFLSVNTAGSGRPGQTVA